MEDSEVRTDHRVTVSREDAKQPMACQWCEKELDDVRYHLKIENVEDGAVNTGDADTCSWDCLTALVESPESPEA